MPPLVSIRARKVRNALTGVDLLGLESQAEENGFLNLVVPTIDVVRGGLVESRIQHAIYQFPFTSMAAGPMFLAGFIRPPEGYRLRVLRANAWCADPGAQTDWLNDGIRTMTRIALHMGEVSPSITNEIRLDPSANIVNTAPSAPDAFNSPLVSNGSPWTDELVAGTDRIIYEPANGLLIDAPRNVGPIVFDAQMALGIQAIRTAAGAGENDALTVALTYSICPLSGTPID